MCTEGRNVPEIFGTALVFQKYDPKSLAFEKPNRTSATNIKKCLG